MEVKVHTERTSQAKYNLQTNGISEISSKADMQNLIFHMFLSNSRKFEETQMTSLHKFPIGF